MMIIMIMNLFWDNDVQHIQCNARDDVYRCLRQGELPTDHIPEAFTKLRTLGTGPALNYSLNTIIIT